MTLLENVANVLSVRFMMSHQHSQNEHYHFLFLSQFQQWDKL